MSARDRAPGRIDAVVIGASAGGVEALSRLLPALQAGCEFAILIVLHLPRERPSLLTEIYRPKCALPVEEAVDKQPVASGTVCFAPPDYHLLVERGVHGDVPHLALSADDPVHYSRPSIDVLFESAADVYGDRLMGIILTGANQDGTAGLEAVDREGGVAIVQEPKTAQSPLMTTSALARTAHAHVLTLDEIAEMFRGWTSRGPTLSRPSEEDA